MNLNDEMKTGKGNIAAQNSAQAIDAVSNLSNVFITVYFRTRTRICSQGWMHLKTSDLIAQ